MKVGFFVMVFEGFLIRVPFLGGLRVPVSLVVMRVLVIKA